MPMEPGMAMPGGMSSGGNRLTQVPAMRLYLDIDPYSDHHGRGFWTGKYNKDQDQQDYQPDEQDVGRPMLSVSHYYEDEPTDNETIKSDKSVALFIAL